MHQPCECKLVQAVFIYDTHLCNISRASQVLSISGGKARLEVHIVSLKVMQVQHPQPKHQQWGKQGLEVDQEQRRACVIQAVQAEEENTHTAEADKRK